METDKGSFGELGGDSLRVIRKECLGEIVGKYFEGFSTAIVDFPFNLGSMEEEGLAAEGLVCLCLGFLLDNHFLGSATSVVFKESRFFLMFFFPDANI
jgi:hypothetical protein